MRRIVGPLIVLLVPGVNCGELWAWNQVAHAFINNRIPLYMPPPVVTAEAEAGFSVIR